MNTKTDIETARAQVCASGQRLLKEGLVARTWGNVSLRLDDQRMVITPSGRLYDELTASDMVVVNYHDGSWEGRIKPSSEMKLHAELYRRRSDIDAVIHTHQMYASVVAAAQRDVDVADERLREILGGSVVEAAPYALPNTKKITVATADAVGDRYAALMANHGAVCCGRDLDDVFEKCLALEEACRQFIESARQNSAA